LGGDSEGGGDGIGESLGVGVAGREVTEGDGVGTLCLGLTEVADAVLEGHVGDHDTLALTAVETAFAQGVLQVGIGVVGLDEPVVDVLEAEGERIGVGGEEECSHLGVVDEIAVVIHIVLDVERSDGERASLGGDAFFPILYDRLAPDDLCAVFVAVERYGVLVGVGGMVAVAVTDAAAYDIGRGVGERLSHTGERNARLQQECFFLSCQGVGVAFG